MKTTTDSEVRDGIARIEGLLCTLVKLQMVPILDRELSDDFAQKLWELTGKATRREIEKKLGCCSKRICDTWSRWEKFGLIIKDGHGYRRMT